MKAWKHFCTITRHKILVMKGCFELGLIRQGLLHDLTKYSPTEFFVGCKYFQGNMSPNDAERMDKGYSAAWLHHKGRNKHHLEYWLDYGVPDKEGPNKGQRKGICGMKMPVKYVVEMYVDRVAASKNYQKEKYRDDSALIYYQGGKAGTLLHEDTKALLELLLMMLAKHGEPKTTSFIKNELLKGRIPYEKTALMELLEKL
ncbi:MAG: catalase [Lachnospiraceae bacterium]|nr:catalase [Lachnospiraceae bacterium]